METKSNSRILIIDDVYDNIQVVMKTLREDNYDFSFATTGKEALSLIELESTTFDLILLDIMMPGLDGFEVCRRLQKDPQTWDIPIIFITEKVDVESIRDGFSLGCVDYIIKPFHAEELIARVRSHLQLFRAKKSLQYNNISLEAKIFHQQNRLSTELENNQKEMIWILTEIMELRSGETGKHIKRVAKISSLLAHYHPTLDSEDEERLYHASPMYDIGKITVPHQILHKNGRYTEEEFEIITRHTSNAYKLLSGSKRSVLIKAAAVIAHEHHEKWDGKGYPRQLKGTEIHIYGRIVALADVFDALTHKRWNKDSWDIKEVITYIQDHRGTQFDPDLVDIMMEHLDEFKAIAELT